MLVRFPNRIILLLLIFTTLKCPQDFWWDENAFQERFRETPPEGITYQTVQNMWRHMGTLLAKVYQEAADDILPFYGLIPNDLLMREVDFQKLLEIGCPDNTATIENAHEALKKQLWKDTTDYSEWAPKKRILLQALNALNPSDLTDVTAIKEIFNRHREEGERKARELADQAPTAIEEQPIGRGAEEVGRQMSEYPQTQSPTIESTVQVAGPPRRKTRQRGAREAIALDNRIQQEEAVGREEDAGRKAVIGEEQRDFEQIVQKAREACATREIKDMAWRLRAAFYKFAKAAGSFNWSLSETQKHCDFITSNLPQNPSESFPPIMEQFNTVKNACNTLKTNLKLTKFKLPKNLIEAFDQCNMILHRPEDSSNPQSNWEEGLPDPSEIGDSLS